MHLPANHSSREMSHLLPLYIVFTFNEAEVNQEPLTTNPSHELHLPTYPPLK